MARRVVALAVVLLIGVLVARALPGGGGTAAQPSATTATTPVGVTPPPTVTGSPSRVIQVAAVGDLQMGSASSGLPSDGGASLFTSVAPLLRGDVVMANLEGTLSTGGASKCGSPPSDNCFAFQTPPSYVRWLSQAGFTVVNLANNHSGDFGVDAREQTLRTLAGADIAAAGVPEGTVTYLPVAGGTVAVIGFGYAPEGMNSILDIERATQIVREAARHTGVVIVTFHGGAEGADHQHLTFADEVYLGENRGDPVAFARAVVDAGADLVVGHGPHVMRAMEVRAGRLIAYSMGNFMGYRAFNVSGPSGQSGVLRVRLAPDGRLLGGTLTSLALSATGVPAPGGSSVARVRELTADDVGGTAATLRANGTIAATPAP